MIECYFGNVTLNRQILVPVLDYSMIEVMWFGFNRRMIWIYGQQNRSCLNFSVLGLVFHISLIVAWSEPVQGLTSLLFTCTSLSNLPCSAFNQRVLCIKIRQNEPNWFELLQFTTFTISLNGHSQSFIWFALFSLFTT